MQACNVMAVSTGWAASERARERIASAILRMNRFDRGVNVFKFISSEYIFGGCGGRAKREPPKIVMPAALH